MGFSNNIQTGTDTGLSGFAGKGATARTGERTRYETSAELKVRGTLTINVNSEYLSGTSRMVVVEDGGHLILDGVTSAGNATTTTYTQNIAIETTLAESTHSSNDASVLVAAGGRLSWNGGTIRGKAPLVFNDTSVIRIASGVWDGVDFFSTYPVMIRCYTSDYQISGLKLVRGGAFVPMKASTHNSPRISYENAYGIGFSGSMTTDVIPYGYIDATNPKGMLAYWGGKTIHANEGSVLDNPPLTGFGAGNSPSNRGRIYCSVPVTIDADANARFYIPNYDVRNLRTDYGYGNFTDANGIFTNGGANFDLPLFVGDRTEGGEQGTNDSGLNEKDYYCRTPNATKGLRRIHGALFGQQLYVSPDIQSYGTPSLAHTPIWIADENVTLSRSQTQALTEITTPAQAHAAYSLYQETSNDNLVSGESWSSIEDGAWRVRGRDVTIDNSQRPAFTVSGNTVTIRANVFVGNIVLDRWSTTLAFENGATIDGTYVDGTRDSAVTIIGVNLVPLDNTLEVTYDQGASWTVLNSNVFPYVFDNDSVLFRYTKGDGEDGAPIVMVDDYSLSNEGTDNQFASFASETAQLLNAQTNTLTNTLNALITTVTNNQTTINEGVKNASLLIPHNTDV